MKNYFSLFLLLFLFGASGGQETVDRIIAVVEENIILESEVLQYAQSLALQNRADPMKYIQDEEIRRQILKQLIDQQVLLASAKDDTTIIVEEREVKREMEHRLALMVEEAGSEADLEKMYGKPMREIKREFEKTIREGLMVDKLRQKKIMGVKVSRGEIEDFYRQNKDKLMSRPETVELSHILLKIEPSQASEEQAKALIDSLKWILDGGADFAEAAVKYSQDAGSAKRGGKLGWTKRGDFVPEFEEAAFALDTGQVSNPVKTRFGWHIVKLNERQGEKINTSHILIKLEPTKEDKQRALVLSDSLYGLLQGGAEFGELARRYSQDETTAADGGALGSFKLTELIPVFAEKIKDLAAGQYTAPFESPMGVQILQVVARQKPRELSLETDWERISQMALNYKQEKVYNEWVDSIKKEVYVRIND